MMLRDLEYELNQLEMETEAEEELEAYMESISPAHERRTFNRRVRGDPRTTPGCVPPPQPEHFLEQELAQLEYEAQAAQQVTVLPRLCFWQRADIAGHRQHFLNQATRWASKISALHNPDSAKCGLPRGLRVGPAPYRVGADIIRAMENTFHCLGDRPLDIIHIFCHSSYNGIFGPSKVNGRDVAWGLYMNDEQPDDDRRRNGARTVSDIPTNIFDPNVVFVLHGCFTAAHTDNFAHELYQHLARKLDNPRVFGHCDSGCAGRDFNWKVFSNDDPGGRIVPNIRPYYSGKGGCAPERQVSCEKQGL